MPARELLALADGGLRERVVGRRHHLLDVQPLDLARDVAHEVGVRVVAVLGTLVAVEEVRELVHPVLVRRLRGGAGGTHRVAAEEAADPQLVVQLPVRT